MKTWLKVLLITLLFGVPSFLLGPVLWSPAPVGTPPTTAQIGLLMGISALESVAFGIGFAFLILGWPMIRSVRQDIRGWAAAAYVSIFWLLASWWPHGNMHMANGLDLAGIIRIDYMFHTTLILASFIVAAFAFRVVADKRAL